MDSPTVLRRRLGSELRKLREERGLRAQDVASKLKWSSSKLSRIESGDVALQERDVRPLLEAYGVTDEDEVRNVQALARKARQPGWWQSYGDALPTWFTDYVGLEADASRIRTFQTELVPGLLQTPDYARAVVASAWPSISEDEVRKRVDLRMERQDIFDRAEPPQFWAIFGEAVLRRPVGSSKIMALQLQRMAKMAQRPNITIQVLPYSAGAHASMDNSFVLLSLKDIGGTVAYAEATASAIYSERPEEIRRHEDVFERLMASSVQPERSVSWLLQVAEEYTK